MFSLRIEAQRRVAAQVDLDSHEQFPALSGSTSVAADDMGDIDAQEEDSLLNAEVPSDAESVEFTAGNPRVEHVMGVVHLFREIPPHPDPVNSESPRDPVQAAGVFTAGPSLEPKSPRDRVQGAVGSNTGNDELHKQAQAGSGSSHAPSLHSQMPEGRGPVLCCLAIPADMSLADFCNWCGAYLSAIRSMRVLRREARQRVVSMVLIRLATQQDADQFFQDNNMRPFSSLEPEIMCRLVWVREVQILEPGRSSTSTWQAGTGHPPPPAGAIQPLAGTGHAGINLPGAGSPQEPTQTLQGKEDRTTVKPHKAGGGVRSRGNSGGGMRVSNQGAGISGVTQAASRGSLAGAGPTGVSTQGVSLRGGPGVGAAGVATSSTAPSHRSSTGTQGVKGSSSAGISAGTQGVRGSSSAGVATGTQGVRVSSAAGIAVGTLGDSSSSAGIAPIVAEAGDSLVSTAAPQRPSTAWVGGVGLGEPVCSSGPGEGEGERDAGGVLLHGVPLPAGTELPTCPVCLERLDEHVSGIVTTVCNHQFHSECLQKWGDTSCPVCRYCTQPTAHASQCVTCGATHDLWICLICGHVGCGRYKAGHANDHWKNENHCYALQLETQRVWDYAGDNYVHRLIQSKTDGKLVEVPTPAHTSRRHRHGCQSGASACSGREGGAWQRSTTPHPDSEEYYEGEESESGLEREDDMKEAMQASKMDHIATEYNHLLTSQLESQRQYFEGLLSQQAASTSLRMATLEAQVAAQQAAASTALAAAKESERKRQAADRRLADSSAASVKLSSEQEFLKSLSDTLLTNQKELRQQLDDTRAELASKETLNKDLQDQVRDLMVYIQAGQLIKESGDDLKDATLLPMPERASNGGGSSSRRQGGSRKGK